MSTATTWKGKRVQSEGRQITIGEQLGAGNEGGVYRIQGSQSEVVKIFDEDTRDDKAEKVKAMIANEPQDPTDERQGKRSIAWPEAVVENKSGVFIGYTMPEVDTDSGKHAFQYAVQDLDWSTSSSRDRYNTALNLAIMVWTIHDQDHAIGDFNHKNILIDDGYVTLIDCDGFHISGEQTTHPGRTFFSRYAPPEKRGKTLKSARRGDHFCLTIHIFQLLMEGQHPYRANGSAAATGNFRDMIQENAFPYADPEDDIVPPSDAPNYNQLPLLVREKFENTFTEAAKKARYGRTQTAEWIDVLADLIGADIDIEPESDELDQGPQGDPEEETISQGPYGGSTERNVQAESPESTDKSANDKQGESTAQSGPYDGQTSDAKKKNDTQAQKPTSETNVRSGPYGDADPEGQDEAQATKGTRHKQEHGGGSDDEKPEDTRTNSDDEDDFDGGVRKGPYS